MDFRNEKFLLGLKIKNFRKNQSYTQEQLSEALGMDVSALSKIENGKCFPSLETLCKIMKTLKIKPDELFDFINYKEKSKIENDIVLEKVKMLSVKDKKKVLAFIDLIKD